MSIARFERGTGLISTNSNNLIVDFKASQLEKDLITTDRKDLQELKERLQKYGKTGIWESRLYKQVDFIIMQVLKSVIVCVVRLFINENYNKSVIIRFLYVIKITYYYLERDTGALWKIRTNREVWNGN